MKERILKEADKLFSHYGIKSITMDELAKGMGISKKTIYQFFENKDDLVAQWSRNFFATMGESIQKSAENASNAIEEALMNEHSFITMFTKMNPAIFHDLKKYFPQVDEVICTSQMETFKVCFEKMIERGIHEKVFRQEINPVLASRIHFLAMDLCFDSKEFPPGLFTIIEIFNEIQHIFLGGLCNEAGYALLQKYRHQPLPSLIPINS